MRLRRTRFAALAGLLLALPAMASAASGSAGAAEDEPAVQRVLLQMKLDAGGKTLQHPGHMTETGSEIILVLTEGKRKHEVSVYLEAAGDKKFKAEVKYTDDGKSVIEQVTTLSNKTWGTLEKGKTKLSLRIDADAKRTDELDLPDGNNPLDGLK